MQSLETGNFSSILDQMDYPPQYTAEEIADDRRAIAVALQFLASRFGRLESYELTSEPVDCHWVLLAMGTELSEENRGQAIAFASRHAKIRSSAVRITASTGGRGWIQSLEFGIPTAVPGAKEQATRIARDMIARMESVIQKPKKSTSPAPEPQ